MYTTCQGVAPPKLAVMERVPRRKLWQRGENDLLEKSKLEFIPEVHTYLVFENEKIDITREVKTETSPFESLLLEIEIQPSQIGEFKVELHRDFLEKWILENDVEYSLDEIWKIREDCISALVLG